MSAPKTLLIVYHSLTGGTLQMAEAARAGAALGGGVAVRLLHAVRFPLHDHCRKHLAWSNPQVLMRFALLQALLIPLLLVLLIKLR